MPKTTLLFGVSLVVLGLGAYLVTGRESVTALIPAFFGLPVVGLGVAALMREAWRKHAMHGAAGLALLGLLGTAKAVPNLLYLLSVGSAHVERPAAVVVQSLMALLCVAYLYFSIRSFIEARRNRAA
jgi:hypothetical protein